MTANELIAYVRDTYSADPEYPWDDENFIFRHTANRKWFAVAMRLPYSRLGLEKPGSVDIVDVKCGPLLMDAYRRQPGILPGYHMNKDNWKIGKPLSRYLAEGPYCCQLSLFPFCHCTNCRKSKKRFVHPPGLMLQFVSGTTENRQGE